MRVGYVVPAGTSWASVIGGWIAAVGAAALVAPAVAGALVSRAATPGDPLLALPVILGLASAYLIGGYVSGRMAGYRTSWHGMITSFFGLFVALVMLLWAGLNGTGVILGARALSDVFPGIRQLDLRTLGDTLTFGALLSFLVTIIAGWLGGLLAPSRELVAPAVPTRVVEREGVAVAEERVGRREPAPSRFKLLPQVARKGGERVERTGVEPRESEASEPQR